MRPTPFFSSFKAFMILVRAFGKNVEVYFLYVFIYVFIRNNFIHIANGTDHIFASGCIIHDNRIRLVLQNIV